MGVKSLLRFLCCLLLFFCFTRPAEATHLYGGEMSYEYLGQTGPGAQPFRYRITLKHYVSDAGNGITPSITFNYYNANGTGGGTFIKSQVQMSTLSPILPFPFVPGCPITFPAIRLRTFVQTIDLPLALNGYYVTAVANARNTDITNLQGGNLSLYMQLPPPVFANPGASPVFTDSAVVVIFAGDTTFINNSAFDADGDKLIYALNEPLDFAASATAFTTPPAAAAYQPGYSFSQPFGAGGHASINGSSGLAKYFVPAIPGNLLDRKFVISMQVKEYRNVNGTEVLIGSTIRDIQLLVKDKPANTNTLPAIAYAGARTITITEGQSLTPLTFTFTDADAGQLLTVTAESPLLDGPGNHNAAFNGITTNQAKLTNVASGTTATFTFTAACGTENTFPLTITVSDNACPKGTRLETFLIRVVKGLRTALPTDISIPVTAMNENLAPNTVIGTFHTVDADLCDVHTHSLIPGTGSTDNAAFTLSADGQLRINNAPDFETQPNYNIRVKTIDENGSPLEKTFTLTVTNLDEAPATPTDADPAANTVAENAATGSSTGLTAYSTDQEGATISYSLTNNAGGRFAINAATGVVTVANAALLDFETATAHQVTVQASDGNLVTTQHFSLAVSDIDEIAPTATVTSTAGSLTTVNPIPVAVTFDEAVTGFTAADLIVTGGTISNFIGSGLAYTFELLPAASGLLTVIIPASVATDAAGNGNAAASPFSITYQAPTGVQESAANALNVQVFPNPTSGTFEVKVKQAQGFTLTVADLTGKVLKTQEVETAATQVTLAGYAPGIYFLKLVSNGQTAIRKLVIQ